MIVRLINERYDITCLSDWTEMISCEKEVDLIVLNVNLQCTSNLKTILKKKLYLHKIFIK